MLEVKADLLYKDHISSSPASRQGDVTYAGVGMGLFLFVCFALCCLSYRAAQHKTEGRAVCPNAYNRTNDVFSFMLSFISLFVISIIHIKYSF